MLVSRGCTCPICTRCHQHKSCEKTLMSYVTYKMMCSKRLACGPAQVPGDSLATIEANLPEPTSVWQKLVPLAVIFFCAGFNLTLIQNASHSLMVRHACPGADSCHGSC